MPFDVVTQTDYILVQLSAECTGEETESLSEKILEKCAETGLKFVIFHATDCGKVTPAFLKQMLLAHQNIKAKNGMTRVVGATEAFQLAVKANGLDRALLFRMSVRGALVDFGISKPKDFDVNVINPFLNATVKVLHEQFHLETTAQRPFLKAPHDPLLLGDVSGLISILSETYNGTLAISMDNEVFCRLYEKFNGKSCPEVSNDNVDLVGELANMILGQAKVELSQLGFGIQMALPSCVWGKEHHIKHFGGGMCVVLPFETPHGPIYSEIMTANAIAQALAAGKKLA